MWNIKNINSSIFDVDNAVETINNLIFGKRSDYRTNAFQLSSRYGWHTDRHKFYERNPRMEIDERKFFYFVLPFVNEFYHFSHSITKGLLVDIFEKSDSSYFRKSSIIEEVAKDSFFDKCHLKDFFDTLSHSLIFRVMSWVPVFLLKDDGMQIPVRINNPWNGGKKTILTPIDTMEVGFCENFKSENSDSNIPFDLQQVKWKEKHPKNNLGNIEDQLNGRNNKGYIIDLLGAYYYETPCIFLWTDKIYRLAEGMSCSADEDVIERYFQNLVVIVFLHELMHALFHVDKPITESVCDFEETFANTSVLYLLKSYDDKDLFALAEQFMSIQPYWYRKGVDLYHSSIEYDTLIKNFFAMKSGKLSVEDFQTKILLDTLKLV